MISSRYSMRLWELMEWALEDGEVPLTIAARHPAGTLDLFDYLFTTAATLREGLQARSEFMHVLTTNSRLGIETETDQEITYSYRHVEPSGRGEELCLQFAVAIFCAGAQAATGRPVVPAHITLAQPAPAPTERLPRRTARARSTSTLLSPPSPSAPRTWTFRCAARTRP